MRVIFLICFLLVGLFSNGQVNPYSPTQNLGSNTTLITLGNTYSGAIRGNFINKFYADTAAANLSSIKLYPFAQICTYGDTLFWIRNSTATKWLQIFTNAGGGGTGDTTYWRLGGNNLVLASIDYPFGTTSNNELNIITNNTLRMVVPATGIVRSSGAANKYLTYDTITKKLYYNDGGSGGGGLTTASNGLTAVGSDVQLGGALTGNTEVDADGNQFSVSNASELTLSGSSYVALTSGSAGISSAVRVFADSISIEPHLGRLKIDTLLNRTGQNAIMGWDSTGSDRGHVGYITVGSGLSLSSGTLTATGSGGTVTSFSATDGNGFDFTVTNPTTTPTLTATTNVTNTQLMYSNSGAITGSANLTFVSPALTIGAAGSTTGQLKLTGSTSGTITLQGANAAGTYSLTLPTNDGDANQVLTTDGSGVTSWTTPASTSPAGNYGNLQIGRNGAFATPASDSLDWESATGLTSKGGMAISGNGVTLNMFNSAAATTVNKITWGTNYGATALELYNGGAGDRWGWGLPVGNMQFFIPNSAKFSINNGGDLQASGTNEIWKADYNNLVIQHNLKTTMNSVRLLQAQGADVASAAGAITLGAGGNVFEITGTASITAINNTNWQNGSEITLMFTSTATLVDGTANSGTSIGFELAGNTNFTATADDVLVLVLGEIGGTQRWREKCRSVN